ncbi:hypothetical protein [Spiroplasma diminutum]|uniref:Uncharacterized protein n=1 Tax=Spiroplasma diminutum CUAS-1 TaxID=1276221 RepID=S5ME85_9MOLU|nr:hypothetical protein [Spiroplasma diminutum]AGR42038.1 hypothetical protein SDIMI_v3c03340 [Spiroplasma diminutum CUAS-1]
MKLNKDIWKFNNAINLLTNEQKDFKIKINSYFNELKQLFLEDNIHLKKIGDFAFDSYRQTNKTFNLDLCAIKYVGNTSIKFSELSEIILKIVKKYKAVPEIHTDQNYINLVFNFQNSKINFRIIPIISKKINNKYVSKVNRNGIVQDDLVLELKKDLKQANKLSSGLLISLKKLLNYIMNGEFNYTYDIDFYLLRWFYEYVSKSLEEYIFQKYNEKKLELDLETFLNKENLRKWIKKNVSFYDLCSFIFLKIESTNTYYFNEFSFEFEEMFDGISRYSINTNSNFRLPINYLSSIKIFDTNLIEDKMYIQNNLSNENGVSSVSWEKFKNNGDRYLVSPIIKTGVANFAMFQKWLTVKSNELFLKLNDDLKSEIKSTKQREAMTELNNIANKWLTIYNTKIKYLQPYFDKKYPFSSNYEVDQLVSLIVQTIDKVDYEQWIIKNDN